MQDEGDEGDNWVIVGKTLEGELAIWAARREKRPGRPHPERAAPERIDIRQVDGRARRIPVSGTGSAEE